MASIFNSLNIGYSGLNASQIGISTTAHNISNAETDGYTRQRVVTSAVHPLDTTSAFIGNGTEIQNIERVFDNFVFDRYTDSYADKEYTDYSKEKLEQLSTYFPEIDNVGIKSDLHEYYNMWQTFSDYPDNNSIKLALAKQSEVLSEHIAYTQDQVTSLQLQINSEIEVNINEVNSLAKSLTEINRSIDTAEAGDLYNANDLRDKRNVIERDLARLIGAKSNYGLMESNIDSGSNSRTGSYTVHVNGFNLVDGTTFHPIHISNTENSNGFYELSYEREDGSLIPIEEKLNEGKIGALLDLRGGTIDSTSGVPKDGILQNTVAELDAFAKGIIESTNNLYARSSTNRMTSNPLETTSENTILSSNLNVNEGSFNLVVYDIDGNIAASREINIDVRTTIDGTENSLQSQMEANVDDNSDGNAGNDVDDFVKFAWTEGTKELSFYMDGLSESRGYTFAIEDNLKTEDFSSGSNFAGALGMSRFFDGDDAHSMGLNFDLKNNPTLISAGYSSSAGDNRVALDMIQHQFENFDYIVGDTVSQTTAYGMFDMIATGVGTETNTAITRSETVSTLFNAIEMEYFSTSKVSLDEEMANLIRYQTSYGAAAKVITTIDQMMETLLGIKR